VAATRVVEALDGVERVGMGVVSGAVDVSGRPPGLQRGEDARHRRIAPDIPGPARRAGDPVAGRQALAPLAGAVRPPIGP